MVDNTPTTPLTEKEENRELHDITTTAPTEKEENQELNDIKAAAPAEKEESQEVPYYERIVEFLFKYYLPISYVFFVVFGALVPQPGAFLNHKATQYICIVSIFIISGLYLRTQEMKEAVVSYKAAIYAIIAILGITPVIGGQLTALLNFQSTSAQANSTFTNNTQSVMQSIERPSVNAGIGPLEYKVGLIILFSMPCTISSGIVMVTQLNGHLALTILLTVVCNIIGIFTVPLYIKWMIASSVNVKLNLTKLISRLCLMLILPLVVGKFFRCIRRVRHFVTLPKQKKIIKILNITLLDILVWTKVSVTSLSGMLVKLTFVNAIFIVGWTLAIHILYILCNTFASCVLMLPYEQRKAVIILCSQKTLVVALSVVMFLPPAFGDQGMIIIAMIISQITMIVFDSVMVAVWVHIDARKGKQMGEEEVEVGEGKPELLLKV